MSDKGEWALVSHDGMVMPFVTLKSAGGIHDDRSFMAGASWAEVDGFMRRGVEKLHGVVWTEILRQVDLSAMAHGYSLVTESADEGWTHVRLVKHPPEPAEVPG